MEYSVIKRNKKLEKFNYNKIQKRINDIINEKNLNVNCSIISMKVIANLKNNISTYEIDELTSRICANLITTHTDYGILASNIAVSNLQKKYKKKNFLQKTKLIYYNTNILSKKYFNKVKKYNKFINTIIDYDRDYLIDYFGIQTLKRSYLLKINKNDIIETPQDLFMRVCLFLHDDEEKIKQSYYYMSNKYFIHATPTLYNSGFNKGGLSSCYLLGTDDSIEGIYKTISDCAKISKCSGGIGVHISNIRGNNSIISTSGFPSSGIIPMLKVYNSTMNYINQGGKRKGSAAIYIEPWHTDIIDYLDLRKPHGDMERRALDLFYALWIPELFFERVKKNELWSLFCPNTAKGLSEVYGEEFNKLYTNYENEKLYTEQIPARELWTKIIISQIESGTPYLCNKDMVNKCSNQKNIGIIKSSNLCSEITIYSDDKEYGVCNLASISLPTFVKKKIKNNNNDDNNEYEFDFEELIKVSGILVENLNRVIDLNYYPIKETKIGNMKHRPIGIGVQGLADTFIKLKLPYDSDKARKLNSKIFETIYYGALLKSNELAVKLGPYSTFKGSPLSKGLFQFDLWDNVLLEPNNNKIYNKTELNYDWNNLRKNIINNGVYNSLTTACMPTASTSIILGNNECIEPITSNLYTRSTLTGTFTLINKYLINDLLKLNLWNESLKDKIIYHRGSIQNISEIPNNIKELYKSVWNISQKTTINMASDRGKFVDQTQSLNLYIADPKISKLSSMYFYAYSMGLKTIIYYLRQKSSSQAQQFSLSPSKIKSIQRESDCEMCQG